MCHLGLSADTSHPSGLQVIAFDTFDEDPEDQFNGTTKEVTIERDGVYLMTLGAGGFTGVASAQPTTIRVEVNTSPVVQSNAAVVSSFSQASAVRCMRLEAGDVVRALAQLHPTVSRTLDSDITFFTVDRAGPVRWTG